MSNDVPLKLLTPACTYALGDDDVVMPARKAGRLSNQHNCRVPPRQRLDVLTRAISCLPPIHGSIYVLPYHALPPRRCRALAGHHMTANRCWPPSQALHCAESLVLVVLVGEGIIMLTQQRLSRRSPRRTQWRCWCATTHPAARKGVRHCGAGCCPTCRPGTPVVLYFGHPPWFETRSTPPHGARAPRWGHFSAR